MANLRELQKQSTRRRLLSTALALFHERGYAATTIDDIAKAASTTRVTFYAHFDSRQDLMIALLGELDVLLERDVETEHGPSARALVEAVERGTVDAIAPWLRAQAARWPDMAPYMLSATEAAASDPQIRELVDAWFDSVIADIAEGLERADRFEPDTRRFRGRLAIAQLDHTALHWMRAPWDLESDPALDVLAESWVGLLGVR